MKVSFSNHGKFEDTVQAARLLTDPRLGLLGVWRV